MLKSNSKASQNLLNRPNPFAMFKPPPFMDMGSPDYRGIPPMPQMMYQEGGTILVPDSKQKKRRKFYQRNK